MALIKPPQDVYNYSLENIQRDTHPLRSTRGSLARQALLGGGYLDPLYRSRPFSDILYVPLDTNYLRVVWRVLCFVGDRGVWILYSIDK